MPRYGEPEYDPDFDDSPPPSPKRKAFHNGVPQSGLRSFGPRLRRSRSTILTFLIITGLIYLWTHIRLPQAKPKHAPSINHKNIDWRMYAYSQYATNWHNLCNAVMVFEALDRLGSKADRILMFPEGMDIEVASDRDRESQLLLKAQQQYGARLVSMPVQGVLKSGPGRISLSSISKDASLELDQSVSKFLAFNQTRYLRIIHLDNDITLYKHLDDLFLLPSTPVAMPRAYWAQQKPLLDPDFPNSTFKSQDINLLSPHLIVLEPSEREAARIFAALDAIPSDPEERNLDSVLVNRLYNSTAMVLPHRGYGLQTGEFRRAPDDHFAYLGLPSIPPTPGAVDIPSETWHADRILREASLVHFAGDDPLPKPWIMWPLNLYREIRPKCEFMDGTASESGCEMRETWRNLYENFRKRRRDICGMLSVPAPEWKPPHEASMAAAAAAKLATATKAPKSTEKPVA